MMIVPLPHIEDKRKSLTKIGKALAAILFFRHILFSCADVTNNYGT